MRASKFILSAAAAAVLAAAPLPPSRAAAAERLPALGADLGQTTTSGLSSGAYMAVQFHVAFSGIVRGVGVVAGGPYYCAEGQLLTNALNRCMGTSLGEPDPDRLLRLARGFARRGFIDPVENLADGRAYLFTGANDRTVVSPVVDAARRFYLAAGLPVASLAYRDDTDAGHGMVTETAGNACPRTAPPYINDCDLDLAGAILGHLYPGLRAPDAGPPRGAVRIFDQTEFFPPPGVAVGLNDTGFAYVPSACAGGGGSCRVHVVFHGCRQTVADIGDQYVRNAGYNRWADGNGIVVLYPQARRVPLANPNGCWDWWGYTGFAYPTKAGPQMAAVRAMLDRLAGPLASR